MFTHLHFLLCNSLCLADPLSLICSPVPFFFKSSFLFSSFLSPSVSSGLKGFFHTKMLPEAQAVTMYFPLGLKCTTVTTAAWPNPTWVQNPSWYFQSWQKHNISVLILELCNSIFIVIFVVSNDF